MTQCVTLNDLKCRLTLRECPKADINFLKRILIVAGNKIDFDLFATSIVQLSVDLLTF